MIDPILETSSETVEFFALLGLESRVEMSLRDGQRIPWLVREDVGERLQMIEFGFASDRPAVRARDCA